jgi:drug/metabolite transporter (DMT)-like permease
MTARKAPARWQADLALALVALVWGATFVVVKQALSGISIVYFLALRFSLAAACLFLIFLPAFLRAGRAAVLKGLRGGAAAGGFLWLGYMLQTFGLKYTTAGKSGFLTGLYIVLAPLASAVVYRRWPQRRELLGIAVAGAGMILMTLPEVGSRFQINPGDLLTIGCAVAYAFHLLVLGYFSQRELFQAVALGQILCAALLSTVSLVIEPPRVRWTPNVIFAVLLTAVFATALAFALQTWGQKFTTATRTALIFALEPVFALATAVLVGHEPLTASAVVGGALILAGILAVELKPLATNELSLDRRS